MASQDWRTASSWRTPSDSPHVPTAPSPQDHREPERHASRRFGRPAPQQDAATEQAIAEGRRIYLGNMLYQVTPDEIERILADNGFEDHGKIHISVDPFTGRNPGYCFIEFGDREQAERAMETLNGRELRMRPVKCKPCVPKRGGGPRNIRRNGGDGGEEVKRFDRWGGWTGKRDIRDEGVELEVPRRLEGKSGPYEALKYLDGSRSEGRQLFVKGLPKMQNQPTNEEEMREFFKGFDVIAVSKRISPEEGHVGNGRRNFCFVDLATKQQAREAIEKLDGQKFLGAPLGVSIARGNRSQNPARMGR